MTARGCTWLLASYTSQRCMYMQALLFLDHVRHQECGDAMLCYTSCSGTISWLCGVDGGPSAMLALVDDGGGGEGLRELPPSGGQALPAMWHSRTVSGHNCHDT